ncbi:MAG: hypothetical protein IKW77_10825 [Salinivirgaceae bacterium]|nr:hypothetical protein [Salinivirgaceae bacterium]
MKKLVLAIMVAVSLVSCNTRQSHVPADWVGSWFSADGGWQCSLFEDVVLYQNDVWQYQSVTETDSTLNLTITNNGRKVELGFIGRQASRKAKLDDGSLMTIRNHGVFVARYSVNGHSEGCVLKNSVNAAVVMCPYWDSIYKFKRPVRIEPKMPVPDGSIGTAVVRLYLRNSFRGPQSVENLAQFLSNDCYVQFDNRLEVSSLKMQLVETDRFGKMYEATIPVDGMASFVFTDGVMFDMLNNHWSLPHDAYVKYKNQKTCVIDTRMNYLAMQGDTVMVVVDHGKEQKSGKNMWDFLYNDNDNHYTGLGHLWPLSESVIFDFDNEFDEDTIIASVSKYLNMVNKMTDSAMHVAPAYSRYYAYAANRMRYIAGSIMVDYMDNGHNVSERYRKFVADSFPIVDSCIQQSWRAIEYGRNRVRWNAVKASSSAIDGYIRHIDEKTAWDKVFSQMTFDLFQTRHITTWLNDGAVRMEPFDIDTVQLESLIAEVKTPGYHNYLENRYKEFCAHRSYIDRVFSGEKLTDDEFAEYERITVNQSAAYLREIQDNLSNYVYALPRVEYKDGPGTYYLYDSEYPNVVIDSMHSSTGHYVFHRNLQVGRSYTIRYKNEDGKEVRSTSFFIDHPTFDGKTTFNN